MLVAISWVLGLLLGVGFAMAGFAKVTEQPVMTKARDHLRLTPSAYRLIGLAELAGAAGALLGLVDAFAFIGFVAVLGLAVLMVGAISLHIRYDDQFAEYVPALAMAILSLLYLSARALS